MRNEKDEANLIEVQARINFIIIIKQYSYYFFS